MGREFIDSFHSNPYPGIRKLHKESNDLADELMRRNALCDNKFRNGAVAPVLFDIIKKNNLNYMMMTEVIEIKQINSGFEVTVYSSAGQKKIHADILIDTTSLRESKLPNKPDILSKSISALLISKDAKYEAAYSTNPLVKLFPGIYDDEIYMRYSLDTDDDWVTAREKLFNYWHSKKDELEHWKIAAIASTFEIMPVVPPNTPDSSWIWEPSCISANLIEAFDRGIEIGRRMVV